MGVNMIKTFFVMSLFFGASFAMLSVMFDQPNYARGLKQSADIISKNIGVK